MSDAEGSEPDAAEPEVDTDPEPTEPADVLVAPAAPEDVVAVPSEGDDVVPAPSGEEDRPAASHQRPGEEPSPQEADGEGAVADEPELLVAPPADDPEAAARIEAGLSALAVQVDAITPDLAATAREETVSAGLAGLQKGVDELVRLTRRSDEHVAELHAENQRLRAGELAGATAPMLRDLVRLHDEVTQLLGAAAAEATGDLELVRSRLLDTLARWGLAPFTAEVGDALDPKRHQGVGRVRSADGAPGTVATVRRPGFAHDDGRTFRAAEVEVFQAPPEPEESVLASSGQEDHGEMTQERETTDEPTADEETT